MKRQCGRIVTIRNYEREQHSRKFHSSTQSTNWRKSALENPVPFQGIKYPLGTDVDREVIFNYPFVIDESTVSFVKQHGRIMFIIRGPPSTGKATLSEMLADRYPSAVHCCADHYFLNSFSSPDRNRENMRASHEYCQNKAKKACNQNKSPVVIQNTHIRKWEMQYYLDLAARYNYTVIMIITMYKFDVTPEALEKCNTDGLKFDYCVRRLRQWEDVIPVLTGWFICPEDTSYLLNKLQSDVKILLNDRKFSRYFKIFDAGTFDNHFRARKFLYCVAGYTQDSMKMKNYYLSSEIQECYGKCYEITVQGYVISESRILSVVQVSTDMKCLISTEFDNNEIDISCSMNSLHCNDNLFEYSKVTAFTQEDPNLVETVVFEDWNDDANTAVINFSDSAFIHIAETNGQTNPYKFKESFCSSLTNLDINNSECIEIGKGFKVYQLANNEWFVKTPQKVKVKSIFTGLYV